MNAQFFKPNNTSANKTHTTIHCPPNRRARTSFPQSRCSTAIQSRCSNPRAQRKIHITTSDETRIATCANRVVGKLFRTDAAIHVCKTNVQCALAQKHCADNRWSATLHGNRLQRSTSTHYRLPAVEVTSNIHMSTHKSCLQNWVCFWTTS